MPIRRRRSISSRRKSTRSLRITASSATATRDKIKGGLVLDSREAALTGGDTGPAVVPAIPAKSLLIEAIRYANEDLQMPPKKATGKLSDEQIALLTEWVKMGAPYAEGNRAEDGDAREGRNHRRRPEMVGLSTAWPKPRRPPWRTPAGRE